MPQARPFIPGLDLAERLYAEGLIGSGSDVLGLDTGRSTDHDWGPRLTIVLVAERFSEALVATITDPEVLSLPRNPGGLDQFMDSTDALENIDRHIAPRRWIASGSA